MKNIDSIKNLATPLSWKDTLVRASKVFVASLIGGYPTAFAGLNIIDLNAPAIKIAILTLITSAGASASSIIINRILLWTQS
jgi:hypothetical protein